MSKPINDGLTKNQRWYRKNNGRARAKKQSAIWRAKHPGANAAACRRYYRKTIKRQRERAREAFQALKARGYSDKRRLKDRLEKSRRRAARIGSGGTVSPAQWLAICKRFRQKCAYCRKRKPLEQDHVIPISKGGRHVPSNLVPACKSCNSSKGNRERPLFLSKRRP